MALIKPAIADAEPGGPITAQAWNEIVGGVDDLFDAVLAIGTGLAEVEVVENGNEIPGAVIVAEPLGEGNPVIAVPPFGSRTAHSIVGVNPGNWRLHIHAEGYKTEVRDVELPLDDRLIVQVGRTGPQLPDVFGLGAVAAVKKLAASDIEVERLIDTIGHEISPFDIPADQSDSPVLMQLPEPGTSMTPGSRVRLVIAGAVRRENTVTMPSLVGLEYDEVVEVLDRLGLRIGQTQTLTTS